MASGPASRSRSSRGREWASLSPADRSAHVSARASPGSSRRQPAGLRRPEAHPRRYVISVNKLVQGAPVDGKKPTPSGRMLRSQQFKYCAYNQGKRRESLVDMEKDPGEMWNLAYEPRYQNVLHQHRAMLREWCAGTHDDFPVPTA